MPRLSLETIAIVQGTLDEVEAQQAAIMLRMWHHLATAAGQEALFSIGAGDGQGSLVQGFLMALRRRVQGRWPRLHPIAGLSDDHARMLEEAFMLALTDVLGARANNFVRNAWTAALREFLTQVGRSAKAAG